MTNQNQQIVERAEAQRDLRDNLVGTGLDATDQTGIWFREWSPGRTIVTVWNTETGEEAHLPRYQAVAAVYQPNTRGDGYLWTAYQDKAPPARVNTVKCFLHPQSAHRAFLDEIGISTTCSSEHLASENAMWAVARNKHPSAYAAYQEETGRRERAVRDQRQMQQTEAMLTLAGRGAGTPSGLESMTNAQLRELAAERGVDVSHATNKAQLIEALGGE